MLNNNCAFDAHNPGDTSGPIQNDHPSNPREDISHALGQQGPVGPEEGLSNRRPTGRDLEHTEPDVADYTPPIDDLGEQPSDEGPEKPRCEHHAKRPKDSFDGHDTGKSASTCFASLLAVYDEAVSWIFNDVLQEATRLPTMPSKEKFVNRLLRAINNMSAEHNHQKMLPKFPLMSALIPLLVAKCAMLYYKFVVIKGVDGSRMPAVYVDDEQDPDFGTYTTDEVKMRRIFREFNKSMSTRDIKETMSHLVDMAPEVELEEDPDLLPMKDGIFNYKTKKTTPFSPDNVFLSKFPATIPSYTIVEPLIDTPDGRTWCFSKWLEEVIPDPDTRMVVWHVLGALMRPRVNWLKVVFLIGRGRNGKGTLIELMRHLAGPENCAALSLKHFEKQTSLSPLLGALANIADENDDAFIPSSELIKSIADHNPVTLRKLYHDPFVVRPHMVNVQAMNDLPSFKDKSDGMMSRILAIPFEKQFLRGQNDNTLIKSDYIIREDVVQWVAYHALVEMDDYYELGESAVTEAALMEYRSETDPLVNFFEDEVLTYAKGPFLSYGMLHEWYSEWFKKTNPSGHPLERKKFSRRLRQLAEQGSVWAHSDKVKLSNWAGAPEARAAGLIDEAFHKTHPYSSTISYHRNPMLEPYDEEMERGLVRVSVRDWCNEHNMTPLVAAKTRGSGYASDREAIVNFTKDLLKDLEEV